MCGRQSGFIIVPIVVVQGIRIITLIKFFLVRGVATVIVRTTVVFIARVEILIRIVGGIVVFRFFLVSTVL